MLKTKLTVRVEQNLLTNIKEYATKHNTTITDLLDAWLRTIPTETTHVKAPIVKRLAGTMSPNVSEEDYHRHLEEKYAK